MGMTPKKKVRKIVRNMGNWGPGKAAHRMAGSKKPKEPEADGPVMSGSAGEMLKMKERVTPDREFSVNPAVRGGVAHTLGGAHLKAPTKTDRSLVGYGESRENETKRIAEKFQRWMPDMIAQRGREIRAVRGEKQRKAGQNKGTQGPTGQYATTAEEKLQATTELTRNF